jgi:predicted nucleotidyltransferase
MTFGLTQTSFEKIKTLLVNNPELEEVKIFGSRAIGTFKEGSDIDIVIYGPNITPHIIRSLMIAYHRLNLPYKLDIIHYESILNPDLKAHIDEYGKSFITIIGLCFSGVNQ